MIRLSHRAFASAHEFLLEINGSADPEDLRSRIPAGLARLIGCERASFNELDTSVAGRRVLPNPVPSWWGQLGAAYQAHVMDHPLLSRAHPPPLCRSVSFDDPLYAGTWKTSTLNHEYFVPLGVRHQLTVAIAQRATTTVGLAINRKRRGFAARDRALLDVVAPHVAQTWRNALAFATLRRQLADPTKDAGGGHALVVVDGERARLRPLSPNASRLLRKYFVVDSAGAGRLPEELGRWLRARRLQSADPAKLDQAAAPLVIRRGAGSLTVRLARARPEEAILLLADVEDVAPDQDFALPGLTRRENEILAWIAEGKRSSEIAVILGLSPRTVEKHLEHIFLKLGVETRTAAIRQFFEFRRNHDAPTHRG